MCIELQAVTTQNKTPLEEKYGGGEKIIKKESFVQLDITS